MARYGMEFNVHASAKDFFFDRKKVIEAISAENHKRLSKAGAFIRQRARTDILRRRKRPSRPGQPPTVHSRDSFLNLRNILFFLSKDWETVVIGPRAIPSRALKNSNRRTVPELMEKGGWVKTRFKMRGKVYVPHYWSIYDSLPEHEQIDIARYQARPFMGPALDKEIKAGTIGNLWTARS